MPIVSNFPGGSLPDGKSGQFVGFSPTGSPVAKNVTAQDVAFTVPLPRSLLARSPLEPQVHRRR